MSKWIFGLISSLATATLACAQLVPSPPDSFQVTYAANLSVGFSNIDITNAGTTGGTDPADNVCANLYVFAQDQQLIACCACPVTPNDLQTVPVIDLISNTLTPGAPTGVTVGMLASAEPAVGYCDAGAVDPATLAPGLRAWSTVVHAVSPGAYAVTEVHFQPAPLSVGELAKMTAMCAFIEADGSFYGICKSCSPGAAGAAKK
jgi:hypothetical protein